MQADFSVELGGDAPALEIPWRSDDPHVRYYDLKKHPELVLQVPEAAAYPELGAFLSRINATEFPLATAKCDAWSSSEVARDEEIFGNRKFVSYVDLIFVDEKDRCSFEKHEAFAKELCRLLDYAPEIAATVELVIRHCYYHQQKFVSANEAEQGGMLSKTVKDSGISLPGDEDSIDHSRQADVTRCSEYTDIALSEKSGNVQLERTPYCEEKAEADKSMTGKCNIQLERKPHREEQNASVTGFCLTAYVTGFGDSGNDPVCRWMIGLNLLQHAIIQLNSKLQPKY